MRCILCENYSFTHICSKCQTTFLAPAIYKRKLSGGTDVISFYRYEEIKELLFTKHTDIGFYIYNILADLSFKKFAEEFHTKEKYVSIGVDDNIRSGYSHTAILNNALKTYNIKPLFNKLKAKNDISYSGKTREFRMLNPRDFEVKSFKQKDVIIVDDIITTGATLTQAIQTLTQENKNVPFCLTLTDVSNKTN
jgi:competence protein ComFC